jgi:hypothetical protein
MTKPIAIVVIAALLLLEGLFPLSSLINPQPGLTNPRPGDIYPEVKVALIVIYALANVVAAVGLFMLKKWGLNLSRILSAVLFVWSLVFDKSVLGIVIYGLILWALFTRTVTSAFYE